MRALLLITLSLAVFMLLSSNLYPIVLHVLQYCLAGGLIHLYLLPF